MRQIGFKNFRKFKDFPPMDLAPITIFVGENNAGKSTVVKGILALSDFLNSDKTISEAFMSFDDLSVVKAPSKEDNKKLLKNLKFFFNTSYLAHIGTFKRALYNKAEGDKITFISDLGYLTIKVTVKGDRSDEEAISGIVTLIELNLSIYNIDMAFDLETDNAVIVFNPNPTPIFSKMARRSFNDYYDEIDHEMTFHTKISDHWYPYRGNLIGSFIAVFENAINATLEAYDNMR